MMRNLEQSNGIELWQHHALGFLFCVAFEKHFAAPK